MLEASTETSRVEDRRQSAFESTEVDAWIASWLRRFSAADRVGQMLFIAFEESYLSANAQRLIREIRPGGVILFDNNLEHPDQARALIDDIQAYARVCQLPPLFIGVDQEGGVISRLKEPATRLPSAMAIGATGRPDLAATWAGVAAREFQSLGFNLNFAPVLDVNTNGANPVIGIRSFGEAPELVAEFGRAAIRGYHDHDIIAVGKHFPGHGDTALDSHLALPIVDRDWDRISLVELPPFIAAIGAGIQAIMTAHVAFPSIDPTLMPATLSSRVLTSLLRDYLGFDGLIITDAIVMEAIASRYPREQASLLSIQAGADLLLPLGLPNEHLALATYLVSVVGSDLLPDTRLESSLRRILRTKWQLARRSERRTKREWRRQFSSWPHPIHAQTARELARASVTLVRNDGTLPLRLTTGQTLGLVEFTAERFSPIENRSETAADFSVCLRRYHGDLDVVRLEASANNAAEAAIAVAERCDALVIATRNAHLRPSQAALVRRLLQVGKPSTVVALRNPYDLTAVPEASAYLASYGDPPCSLQAVADVLFGAIGPRGRLPVSLSDLHPAGHGLRFQT